MSVLTERDRAIAGLIEAALDYRHLHERLLRAASADRSGEAGETRNEAEGLDPKGESAVGEAETPNDSND